jgi:hypothetical protein
MNIYEFMAGSPFLTFFLALCVASVVASVSKVIIVFLAALVASFKRK